MACKELHGAVRALISYAIAVQGLLLAVSGSSPRPWLHLSRQQYCMHSAKGAVSAVCEDQYKLGSGSTMKAARDDYSMHGRMQCVWTVLCTHACNRVHW